MYITYCQSSPRYVVPVQYNRRLYGHIHVLTHVLGAPINGQFTMHIQMRDSGQRVQMGISAEIKNILENAINRGYIRPNEPLFAIIEYSGVHSTPLLSLRNSIDDSTPWILRNAPIPYICRYIAHLHTDTVTFRHVPMPSLYNYNHLLAPYGYI